MGRVVGKGVGMVSVYRRRVIYFLLLGLMLKIVVCMFVSRRRGRGVKLN